MANQGTHTRIPQARTENLLVQDIADETIVYDLNTHRVTRLNESAAAIWRSCDGRSTANQISDSLVSAQGSPVGEEVVWHAVERLSRAGLLADKVKRPSEVAGYSRRDLLRRTGMVAGMAALLPVVHSVLAPTAAEAQGVSGTSLCLPSQVGRCCCVNGRTCRQDGASGNFRCNGPNCTPVPGTCV